jgi:hypothetical protein
MRLKADFVTNSSSTCFVLQFDCYLKEKVIKNINDINCKKYLEDVKELYCNNDSIILSTYSDNGWAKLNGFYMDDKDSGSDRSAEISLELLTSESYNDKTDKVNNTLLLNMKASSLILNEDPGDIYINELGHILYEVLKNIKGNLEVFYHQFPREIMGDGWDAGDPMGQYTTKVEVMTKQTKIGKITRKKGMWNFEVKND